MKIGFLGPEGTFSQEAALRYAKDMGLKGELVSFLSISDMFYGVRDLVIDEAVVPIENSIEGAVSETLDMLAGDVDLKIGGEKIIGIRQNLMAKEGTQLKDIREIYTHPQPLGQCRKFLKENLPHAQINIVYSTAKASAIVAQERDNKGIASIGAACAAQVYGLKILKGNIQDNKSNYTRFVIIRTDDSKISGKDKTSIVFSTRDKPGSLYAILEIFNLWDINMTRIESRPAKKELGKYIFFVDLEGHREDDDLKDALKMVKRKTTFYKLLGSYGRREGEDYE